MEKIVRVYLLKARKNAKLSQKDAADKLGIDRSYYVNIENNRRDGTIDLWKKVQKLFNFHDDDMWKVINRTKSLESE